MSFLDFAYIVAMMIVIGVSVAIIIATAKGRGASEFYYFLLGLISFIGVSGIIFRALSMGGVLEGLSKEFTWTFYIAFPAISSLVLLAVVCVHDDYVDLQNDKRALEDIQNSLGHYKHGDKDHNLFVAISNLQGHVANQEGVIKSQDEELAKLRKDNDLLRQEMADLIDSITTPTVEEVLS